MSWIKVRGIIAEEWKKIAKEYELRPGNITEKFVARITKRIDEEMHDDDDKEPGHDRDQQASWRPHPSKDQGKADNDGRW